MMLEHARETWLNSPRPFTAGKYMQALMERQATSNIDDDDLLKGLTEIRNWLLNGELPWRPTRQGDGETALKFRPYLKPVT